MSSSIIASQAGVDLLISSASKERQRTSRIEKNITADPIIKRSALFKLSKPEAAQPLTSLRGLYFVKESTEKLKKAKLYYPKLEIPSGVLKEIDGVVGSVRGYKKSSALQSEALEGSSFIEPSTGCETCASRKYKDSSDDSGVSFQTATKLPVATAGIAVMSHEGEHVSRETARAQKSNSIVTQKTVTAKMSVCPECGRMYIAGGTTRITTRTPKASGANVSSMDDVLTQVGEKIDQYI